VDSASWWSESCKVTGKGGHGDADAAFTKPAKGGTTPDLSPIDLIQYWHFYRQIKGRA